MTDPFWTRIRHFHAPLFRATNNAQARGRTVDVEDANRLAGLAPGGGDVAVGLVHNPGKHLVVQRLGGGVTRLVSLWVGIEGKGKKGGGGRLITTIVSGHEQRRYIPSTERGMV